MGELSEPKDPVDAVFARVAEVATDVRAALAERRAVHGEENPSGEVQLAADVYADERLEAELLAVDGVASYASEERTDVVWADVVSTSDEDEIDETAEEDEDDEAHGDYEDIEDDEAHGDYEDTGYHEAPEDALHVACDPLDGSSNLESNNGMGTIVGVYDEALPAPGSALVAAGYVLYGPITTMVVARDSVTEYLLENGDREVLNEDVSLPADPIVYGFGGRVPDWPEDFAAFVEAVEADRLKLRYGGAMVADVNQVLTYGGVFGYPMLADAPEGKLRLQFEGHPMAHVIETAGGASTDGTGSLLATSPAELHERSPVFVGNEDLVDSLEDALE